jgi:phospholipase C
MMSNLNDKNIEHVVVLMLENRGFDHVMGSLYSKTDKINLVSNDKDQRPFMGLLTLSKSELKSLGNKYPKNPYKRVEPILGARSPKVPSVNPGEHFVHIMGQMWGIVDKHANWGDKQHRESTIAEIQQATGAEFAPMNGYILDYYQTLKSISTKTDEQALIEIMETYLPEQLPVLSGLAQNYAISDEWFCSVPSQTNTNRAFSMAGTARGMVSNNFYDAFIGFVSTIKNPGIAAMSNIGELQGHGGSHADKLPKDTRNVLGLLSENDCSWALYWQDYWPPRDVAVGRQYEYVKTMFPDLEREAKAENFIKFDASDADNDLFCHARAGKLPAVSWIEPKWGGGPSWNSPIRQVGNDMHPSCDTTVCEDFVCDLYNALSSSPKWQNTLFVITFDENGGTYDHMCPPAASPSYLDRAPMPKDYQHMDPSTRTEFGFKFDQFGIRVPTILISPLIEKNTVFRTTTAIPFDHTSIIATILDWQKIDRKTWQLGQRVAQAPTFDQVLQLSTPRDTSAASQALSIDSITANERTDQQSIAYEQEFYLQYIDSKWPETELPPQYLSFAEWSYSGLGWYPTITSDPAEATKVKFNQTDTHLMDTDNILNLSELRLESVEPNLKGSKYLTASHNYHNLYYQSKSDSSSEGQLWQLRVFASMDGNEVLKDGDDIYLVSKLKPNLVQDISARISPDPLQRMIASKKDPKYLTTEAGEWAIWKILTQLPE